MTVISNNTSVQEAAVTALSALLAAAETNETSGTSGTVPDASLITSLAESLDLPSLPLSQSSLSLDTLLNAISDEARRNNIQQAVDSLETKGEAMETENAKKLEKIKEQLDELKNQSFWDKFVKVFEVIGMVVGAIASAVTTAVGAMTGNPALIAAGVIGLVMTAESIMSTASDGKISLSAGLQKFGEMLGMDEETAKWFAMGVQLAVSVATIAVSFGAAAASSGANAANAATKGLDMLTKTATISNIASGVTNVGKGIGQAALTVSSYNVAKSKAESVDIDAILENMRAEIKMLQEFTEEEMKAAENLMSTVKDIVDNVSDTRTAILTGSPATA